jgi:hypothetical protein
VGEYYFSKEKIMRIISFNDRLCGNRIAAAVYAETKSGNGESPVEHFLVDPARSVDPQALGVTALGVKLIQIGGIWHIFDIVGEEHYPLPADFVEEVRHMGSVSRRLPGGLDYLRLTEDSRLFLIHHKAIFENYTEFPLIVPCPKGVHRDPLPEMCAGLWWQDLPCTNPGLFAKSPLERKIGRLSYTGYQHPEGTGVAYRHGIFMILPISDLCVIKGRNPTENKKASHYFKAACRSGLPVIWKEE